MGTTPCLKHRAWKPSSTTAAMLKSGIWKISAPSSPFHPLQTIKNQKARADAVWKQQLRQHCRQDPLPRQRIYCCWRQKDGLERLLSCVRDRQQTPTPPGQAAAAQVAQKQVSLRVCLGNYFLPGTEQDGNIRGLLSWFQKPDFPCSPGSSPQLREISLTQPVLCRYLYSLSSETALRYHDAENGKSFSITPVFPPWEFKKQAKYNKETSTVMFNQN